MAVGAKLLDSSGRKLLDADGRKMLSDGAGDACCCECLIVAPARYCSDGTLATRGGEQVYGRVCAEGSEETFAWWSLYFKACLYADCAEASEHCEEVLLDQARNDLFHLNCDAPECDQDGDGNPDPPDPTPEPTLDPDVTVDCCGDPTDEYYEVEFAGAGGCDCQASVPAVSFDGTVANGTWTLPVAFGSTCGSLNITAYSIDYTSYTDGTCTTVSSTGTKTLTLHVDFNTTNAGQWTVRFTDLTNLVNLFTALPFGDCDGGTAANVYTCVGGTVTIRKRAPLP